MMRTIAEFELAPALWICLLATPLPTFAESGETGSLGCPSSAANELLRRGRSFLFVADTVSADYVDAGKFADLLKNLQQ